MTEVVLMRNKIWIGKESEGLKVAGLVLYKIKYFYFTETKIQGQSDL